MSDEKKVPIFNRSTGETSFGERAPTLKESAIPGEEQAGPAQPAAASEVQRSDLTPDSDEDRTTDASRAKTTPEVTSMAQFIEQAYRRAGKRIALTRSIEKQIRNSPSLDTESQMMLLELAKGDSALLATRQLLLAAIKSEEPRLAATIREFVKDVMLAHPALASDAAAAAIRNLPDALDLTSMLLLIKNTTFDAINTEKDERSGDSSKVKSEEVRNGLMRCIAVWFFHSRSLPLSELIEALDENLWSEQEKGEKDAVIRLRAVTEAEDWLALGATAKHYSEAARASRRSEEEARRRADEARSKEAALRGELDAQRARVQELNADLDGRDQMLEAERQRSEAALTHLRTDSEQVRTRLLKRLRDDVALLDDALYALRKEPPKVAIVDDHMERVLEALRREIRNLEGTEG